MKMKPDSESKSQIFNIPRLMIAAPASGSGKTTLTCALLRLLQNRGKSPVSFKCGPDFIDSMFHEQVLGVPSTNLDSFFVDEEEVREIFAEKILSQRQNEKKPADFAVIEGVMGLFDGLAGKSLKASSYDIARITNTPILLCVDASGMSRSIVPLVKGFLDYDRLQHKNGENLIKGIFLNKVSKGSFQLLKALIEEESASYGVKVIGYLPKDSEIALESRHLGLFLPDEIKDLNSRIQKSSQILDETTDFTELAMCNMQCEGEVSPYAPTQLVATPSPKVGNGTAMQGKNSQGEFLVSLPKSCARRASPLKSPRDESVFKKDFSKFSHSSFNVAVARDEAFCFYYDENLRLLEESGANLVYFSPLHDKALPSGIGGILLGGGYPELHAAELEANRSMRESIKSAVENGIAVMAECGGFMYLQEKLTDKDGVSYEMCGAIKGECAYTGKLVRFGYAEFASKEEEKTEGGWEKLSVRGHEFHYFDSTNNGSDFTAKKPLSSRSWDCMIHTEKMLAGFPHLYYRSNPKIVEWFLESCKKD